MRLGVSEGKHVLGGCDPGEADLGSVGCEMEPLLGCLGDQPCLCKAQKHTGSSGCTQQTDGPSKD